jgi:hypothetical protein
MSAAPTTFYVPTLERPSPTASWESRRSPASSFSKGPRPTGDAFDLRRSSLSSTSSSLPPPYIREHSDEESIIPAYGEEQEVKTMARSLFFYGFLFPPFWLLGSLILITPLTPDPSWHSTKPEEQIQVILSAMRVAERRWAWRCVTALSCLILIILVVVSSLLLAHHFGRI